MNGTIANALIKLIQEHLDFKVKFDISTWMRNKIK